MLSVTVVGNETMTDHLRVSRGELTSTEVLEALEEGRRVIIEVDALGMTMEMAVREQRGTYYCDTPVKLFQYESAEELRACLERYRLAKPDRAREVDAEEPAVD